MYKLFLCLRYLYKRRIVFFAVGAVCLCVMMVLIVISVMGGFLNMVKDRSRGMLGDLIVESTTLQGFPFYEEFIARLKAEMPDEIHEATPVIITFGTLRFPRNGMTKPVQVVGIDLEETYRVNDFKEGLFYEKYYPGTTHFERQQEPYLGLTKDGQIALPPELEAARRRWEANASPQEIADAWRDQRLLLEVEADDLPKELNRGRIPAGLKRAFENRLFQLPDKVEVAVAKKGKKWLLRHAYGVNTIQRDGDKLKVYYSAYTGPGYFAEPESPLSREGPGWQGRPLPGVILGTDLCAERLRTGGYARYCRRGEMVALAVIPFNPKGGFQEGTGFLTMPLRYVDDCRTGVYDIDSMSVYVSFEQLQDIVNMTAFVPDDRDLDELASEPEGAAATRPSGPAVPARTTQVQIKLKPTVDTRDKVMAARNRVQAIWERVSSEGLAALRDAPNVLDRIEGPVSWVKVQTWEEKQARYIGAVEKEKYLVTILFAVISVVAVFLVGVIFYMIVQQKTRDIGIIKSVGATSLGVAGIFLSYGAAVGVVGGAFGTALGTVFVWYINEIQDLLIWISPSAQVWNPEVYAFDRIPSEVNPSDAIGIYIAAILASVAGALIAAWKASKVWPVEALRYE
ncbi:MAG TPA: FtsX-like permease family protein [Phycisphaerae bacterium]|jgi:ABC-type lipoprotein release transport system permease subunit|nr:FtsX-like permease family protein [Phycisphaerae bacterium]HOJ55517.1 FtsX-like permease family protein [Phycisphaerae bacterium]HOL26027.1 FtsX-like permease family protein [Phycisphaerae bacterium]HPP22547.1 FtsX-like permease family protein [Phycisphaerae bacterium]HPU33358.1 FtsX-like permease family protein [Phycisphaerae bacterium]